MIKRITLCFVATLLLVVAPIKTQALSRDDLNSIITGSEFYDASDDTCASGSGSLSGSDNKAIIFNYLVGKMIHGKALTDYQVAGIMGNMQNESGFQPQRLQHTKSGVVTPAESLTAAQRADPVLGWGLVQWTPVTKVIDPLTAAGKDPNKIENQLDFLLEQLSADGTLDGKAGQAVVDAANTAEAAVAFEGGFERHAPPPDPERIINAEDILRLAIAGGVAAPTSSDSDCPLSNAGLAATVFAYAWPEYHARPYVNMTEAYQKAVVAAKSKGLYIGGSRYPGVDCGGFVTRVMLDSGFEPRYNFSGALKDGAGNVASAQSPWLEANWQKLGHVNSTSELQSGDVAIRTDFGHTYMFAGDIPGFGSKTASASLDERSPMAGSDDVTASDFVWYRKR